MIGIGDVSYKLVWFLRMDLDCFYFCFYYYCYVDYLFKDEILSVG